MMCSNCVYGVLNDQGIWDCTNEEDRCVEDNLPNDFDNVQDVDRGIIIDEEYRCPLCGAPTYCYNNPSDDPSMGTYCTDDDCEWFSNQFISYEDMIGEGI